MILKEILTRYPKLIRNKFFWTTMVFLVWITFFDEHNMIRVWHNQHNLNQLKQDIGYYHQKIEDDRTKLKELGTNKSNLEKFAREQYLMKKENEDVYIVLKNETSKEK
ncbi:MAG: septum formation initiator family protein [Bacteroidota bacterium]|nr:septum formation initiator family protein [Bacteroidota bacterium]